MNYTAVIKYVNPVDIQSLRSDDDKGGTAEELEGKGSSETSCLVVRRNITILSLRNSRNITTPSLLNRRTPSPSIPKTLLLRSSSIEKSQLCSPPPVLARFFQAFDTLQRTVGHKTTVSLTYVFLFANIPKALQGGVVKSRSRMHCCLNFLTRKLIATPFLLLFQKLPLR